jgi:hypothetical protein
LQRLLSKTTLPLIGMMLYIYLPQTLHKIYTQNYESLEFELDKSVQHKISTLSMLLELNYTDILIIFFSLHKTMHTFLSIIWLKNCFRGMKFPAPLTMTNDIFSPSNRIFSICMSQKSNF